MPSGFLMRPQLNGGTLRGRKMPSNKLDRELLRPPAADQDPDSFEILRLWAADGEQHVTIHPRLAGGAEDFGVMLAQLARHGARLYSQRDGHSFEEALTLIREGLREEFASPTGKETGEVSVDH